ncbi:MAG: PEP-CTERM sorting domain-containing protein [Thermodesulfobacteriota bacterium]
MLSKRVLSQGARIALAAAALLVISLCSSGAMADTMNVATHGNLGVTYWVNGVQRSAQTAEFYSTTAYHNATWFGYCLDPVQTFANPITPGDPNLWTGPEVNPKPLQFDWKEAAWLMENYAPGVTWLDDPSSVNYDSAAVKNAIQAVQLAIWEVVMDHSTTYSASNLTDTSSNFYVASSAVATLAGSYLVALSEAKIANGGQVILSGALNFTVNDQDDRQDLIMASKAPEPGSMLLLASGLAATGGWLRRRRQKSRKA